MSLVVVELQMETVVVEARGVLKRARMEGVGGEKGGCGC
jgi:hypothetical protein